MSRIQTLLACCLVLMTAVGCHAQPSVQSNATPPQPVSAVNQRIEAAIRNSLNVPPEYELTLGPETPSGMEGYNTVPVTFSLPDHPEHTLHLDYLVSKDGKTLARLVKYDIGESPNQMLPIAGRPVRGNPQAKVTIVNFDDLECPFCARFHSELFPTLFDHYKGLIRVIYVDYPLVGLHPWAMHAAVDANCIAAESHSAYWNFVDYVHEHGDEITGNGQDPAKAFARLDQLAEQEGAKDHLDATQLDACIKKQDQSVVLKEMLAAQHLGVDATPTFYVNGVRWSGLLPEAELELMINRALRQQGITPPASAQPAAAQPEKAQPEKTQQEKPQAKDANPKS